MRQGEGKKQPYSTKQFAEFERRNDLFSLTYNGVPYWQLIRFPISEQCLFHADGIVKTNAGYTHGAGFAKIFCKAAVHAVKQRFRLHRLQPADLLLFYTTDQRTLGENSCNPFFDLIAYGDLTTQKVWDTQDFTRLPEDAFFNIAPAVLRGYLYKLWYRLLRGHYRDTAAYQQLRSVVQQVNETFGTSLSEADVRGYENEILYLTSAYKGFVPYFKKLLRRIQPRAIVLKCYYMVPCFMMIAAARELGIPVIELEHGHIYNHISYCFSDKTPKNKLVPDYLFTFNRFFTEACELTDATTPMITGYPFLERSLAYYKQNSLDAKTLVFYSQPTLGHLFTQFMLDFLAQGAQHGYRAVFKLHPGECAGWQQRYPELVEVPQVRVDDDPSTNVYFYLAGYRHQVVADSTTAFEITAVQGAQLYIPLCCPHSNTQPMLDLGFAAGVETAAQLLALVQKSNAVADAAQGGAVQNGAPQQEAFWPTGAAEMMHDALYSIVSQPRQPRCPLAK